MKRLALLITIILCMFSSCRTIQYVPVETDTKIEYRDTTIYKDSVIYIPKETIREVMPLMDTLYLETSLAQSWAAVDTSMRVLLGELKNKKGITEKITYKEKTVYRDSIVVQAVPVEVEKIKEVKTHFWYEKILWFFSIIGLVALGMKIYPLIKKWLL